MEFHLFPKLPAELRLEIWRLCLPHLVLELDNPFSIVVYIRQRYFPCILQKTTQINGHKPLIALVCREARDVAYKAGHEFDPTPDNPVAWASGTSLYQRLDPARDTVHLNWEPAYGADYNSSGDHPVEFLAWVASTTKLNGASFMFGQLSSVNHPPSRVLALRPSWRVVVYVVVIHAGRKAGAESELFGLLGDAHMQIIDVASRDRVDAYFRLFEACRGNDPCPQDISRELVKAVPARLRERIAKVFWKEGAPPTLLVPAIMFRFYTGRRYRTGARELESWDAREERRKTNPSPPSDLNRGRGRGRRRVVCPGPSE
ncbi:2EXR domain-containing protein [Aspergillus mulundensis]|uniref:2EXR domain-containing protein n=1 Tax=Aspergillus mulundensis TaxID=1810919 RepID=A0A3D8S5B1_9EURO|nr:hypothetical protein DSM5745_05039 [Aspergillus mulundensis]RDW81482.1 hypothetical protein DSM5745_05039 [Aspergillus mulundensis]